jgi:hypothetical protein
MPLAGFEPANPKSERLQTHALERAATEIGDGPNSKRQNMYKYTISNSSNRENSLFHLGVAEAFVLVSRVTTQKREAFTSVCV